MWAPQMRLSLSLSLSSFSTTHTVDIPLHLSSGKTVSHQDSGLRVKRLSSFKQNLVSTIDFHENQSPASPVMRTDRHDEADCLLPIKRYNLYKVLACSTAFFQLSLFCAIFFQLCTYIFLISPKTSFSQRVLDLPIGLFDMGFHLLMF